MSVTWCLGDFANRISRKPQSQWRDEIARQPKVCPRGCKVNCRAVCQQYAVDQRDIAKGRAA